MAKATKANGKETEAAKQPSTRSKALPSLGGLDPNTEEGHKRATMGLWNVLAEGMSDPQQTAQMINILGKVIARENIKIRSGFYKVAGAKAGTFFLTS